MIWFYLLVFDIACIGSGTALVLTEHYWWAWLPFLLACTTSVVTHTKKEDEKK